MVAENDENWYTGEGLTIILRKNTDKAPDSPPFAARPYCNLCSEARYEVRKIMILIVIILGVSSFFCLYPNVFGVRVACLLLPYFSIKLYSHDA